MKDEASRLALSHAMLEASGKKGGPFPQPPFLM